ncbi:MAG: type VII toxin-antitoxin system HepT family RNase toxin [Anaerolineales bacterium]
MLLDEYIKDLRELQSVNFDEYEENKLIRRAVERTLHLAVETCLDIGQQIIAREGFRTPENYKDVFIILKDEGILPTELLPNAIAMASFRNLIVHDYARIDNAAVFGILKRRLGDFDAFIQAVIAYLETKNNQENCS